MQYPTFESNTLELKRELPRNEQVIKTIIGFCNTHGGKLIIGVSDDRRIIGLSEQEIETAMEKIDQSVFDACAPNIIPKLYVQLFDNKSVLVVDVLEGMNKPYYQRAKGIENGTYVRLGRHTMKAKSEVIQELKWQSNGVAFEKLPVPQATMEDLEIPAIEKFLTNRKNQGVVQFNEPVMKSYDLIAYEQGRKYPSTLGILLFGKNPQQYFSEAMIICTHFSGVKGREAIAAKDCEGTLFNQFHQAFEFINSRLYHSFTIKGLKREETLEIPKVAIREALLNIIVHRNYHTKAPSKIAIYDDRIEFFSPGQFPGMIVIENLKSGITCLRNTAICKILREANYIEKLGSGFITIFGSYEKQKLQTPKVIEGDSFVKCILPRYKRTIVKSVTMDDITKIIELCDSLGEITTSDVIQALSVSRATAVRRLNAMLKAGKLIKTGKKRSVRYSLGTKHRSSGI